MQKRIFPGIGLAILFLLNVTIASELPETINRKYQVTGKELRAKVRMDAGEFTLARSQDAQTIWVHISYNPERCDVHVSLDEKDGEFYLDVDHSDWIKDSEDDDIAKVRIELPAEPVTDLDARIKVGELKFDLGGLSLRRCKIRSYAGELTVDFDEPNRIRMDMLDVNCSIGESSLQNLGFARFHRANLNSGIGEMSVDFSGWDGFSGEADLDNDLGEMSVDIPKETAVKIRINKAGFLTDTHCSGWFEQRGRYLYSRHFSDNKEHLYLRISSGIGELDVDAK